jgi:hypothetical protein
MNANGRWKSFEGRKFDYRNQSLSRKPGNPEKCRESDSEPESQNQKFSWLHGFLLNPALSGLGKAPLVFRGLLTIRSCEREPSAPPQLKFIRRKPLTLIIADDGHRND